MACKVVMKRAYYETSKYLVLTALARKSWLKQHIKRELVIS